MSSGQKAWAEECEQAAYDAAFAKLSNKNHHELLRLLQEARDNLKRLTSDDSIALTKLQWSRLESVAQAMDALWLLACTCQPKSTKPSAQGLLNEWRKKFKQVQSHDYYELAADLSAILVGYSFECWNDNEQELWGKLYTKLQAECNPVALVHEQDKQSPGTIYCNSCDYPVHPDTTCPTCGEIQDSLLQL